jgi:hypothetical protein
MAPISPGPAAMAKEIRETLELLDPVKHRSLRTVILTLAHLAERQDRMAEDIDLLHRKIQPILKYLEEELGDWRLRTPKFDE